jgi:hypothetical protein
MRKFSLSAICPDCEDPKSLNVNVVRTEYVEIKCQLDAAEVLIADLIACSTCFGHHYAHHRDLKIL